MSLFTNIYAWFSPNVSQPTKQLWLENGGLIPRAIQVESQEVEIDYFFAEFGTEQLVIRLRNIGIKVIHSNWITQSLSQESLLQQEENKSFLLQLEFQHHRKVVETFLSEPDEPFDLETKISRIPTIPILPNSPTLADVPSPVSTEVEELEDSAFFDTEIRLREEELLEEGTENLKRSRSWRSSAPEQSSQIIRQQSHDSIILIKEEEEEPVVSSGVIQVEEFEEMVSISTFLESVGLADMSRESLRSRFGILIKGQDGFEATEKRKR